MKYRSNSCVSRFGKNGVRKSSEKQTMSACLRAACSIILQAPGTPSRQSSLSTGPVCAAARVIMRAIGSPLWNRITRAQRHASAGERDALDFDLHSGGELHAACRAGRRVLGEELMIDAVHVVELEHVVQEDVDLHDALEGRAGRFEQVAHIGEGLPRL